MASMHHEVVVGSYRWGRPPNVRKSIEAEDIIDVPKRWVGNASSSHTSVHEDDSSDASCPHEEAPKLHELRKFDEQASGCTTPPPVTQLFQILIHFISFQGTACSLRWERVA